MFFLLILYLFVTEGVLTYAALNLYTAWSEHTHALL